MTTKKQRREAVAARRAIYDAETKRMGLDAQKRDHDRRAARQFEAEQNERQKKAAKIIKDMAKHGTTLAEQVEIANAES